MTVQSNYLADYLPTEKLTLTPNSVRLLVEALTDYYPEMPDRELYYRLLGDLRKLKPFEDQPKQLPDELDGEAEIREARRMRLAAEFSGEEEDRLIPSDPDSPVEFRYQEEC